MASGELAKRPLACRFCREKKVKCDGGHPCTYCQRHDEECSYPVARTRKKTTVREKMLEERLAKAEALLKAAANYVPIQVNNSSYLSPSQVDRNPSPPPPLRDRPIQLPLSLEDDISRDVAEIVGSTYSSPAILRNLGPSASPALTSLADPCVEEMQNSGTAVAIANDQINQLAHSEQSLLSPPTTSQNASSLGLSPSSLWPPSLSTTSTDMDAGRSTLEEEDGGIIEHNFTCEYHGAGSILSICSRVGSQWVLERTGANFIQAARQLTTDVTNALKLNGKIHTERAAEPEWEEAWELSQAYFREFETVFSFVCRTAFEADLRAYFNPNAKAPECPASYALRHVVYAGGKRSIIKNNSAAAFDEIHAQSWPYFENALYVHTDLLYSKCSITAVQALMAMSIYVEGIGCPSLEYMLCSNAVRLAQSKGLHRQPPIAWNLPESEVQQRKWLFWAIYCYDKHISYRSGRPSAIEDDTITCSIPTSIPPGSNHDIIWCTNVIKLTYILSAVMKYIQTLQNKETKTKDILKPVEALNARIIEWKKQVPFPFQPDEDIVVSGLSPKVHIYCVLFMRFHYYGTLVALNSAFVYPWIFANRKREHDRLFQDQVRRSTDLVVEASREIIKNTKYVDIDYACPVWLAFYYPMVGLINLFIHVLRYPTLSSVQMDLALIDIATGHFARVGYTSSHSISFPFARELARLAHEAVRATYWGSELLNLELSDVNGIGEHQNQEIISLNDNPQGFREELNRSSDLVDEMEFADFMDTELNWGSLLPIPSQVFHNPRSSREGI